MWGLFTWPAISWPMRRNILSGHSAWNDLWAQRRCAPVLTPIPAQFVIQKPTVKRINDYKSIRILQEHTVTESEPFNLLCDQQIQRVGPANMSNNKYGNIQPYDWKVTTSDISKWSWLWFSYNWATWFTRWLSSKGDSRWNVSVSCWKEWNSSQRWHIQVTREDEIVKFSRWYLTRKTQTIEEKTEDSDESESKRNDPKVEWKWNMVRWTGFQIHLPLYQKNTSSLVTAFVLLRKINRKKNEVAV